MAQLSDCHKQVNELGDGGCSVPMWSGGSPDGFCDKPAYGFRPEGKTHRRWDGFEWRDDGKYAGYVPGLACPCHGGPDSRVFKDGNMWCAVWPNFIDLQQSPAGFGETQEIARANLRKQGEKQNG